MIATESSVSDPKFIMSNTKSILILGRRDPTEAMRVAAGLTIYDHQTTLVFMKPVAVTEENVEMAELLEFSDVESFTILATDNSIPHIDAITLATALIEADEVINI